MTTSASAHKLLRKSTPNTSSSNNTPTISKSTIKMLNAGGNTNGSLTSRLMTSSTTSQNPKSHSFIDNNPSR